MAERKLLAGHAVRRLRRREGLTQAAMAEMLTISPSYLNLVEKNQRPLSAAVLVKLAETFDFDPRALAAGEPGGGAAAIRRRLADPMFADLEIDRNEVEEWLAGAPGGAEAFARAFDRMGARRGRTARRRRPIRSPRCAARSSAGAAISPISTPRRRRWPTKLRLGAGDLYGAIAERLRVKHQLTIRILPVDVMPDLLRRTDLHARQLQLSRDARPRQPHLRRGVPARADRGARRDRGAGPRGAAFADRAAERLYRRYLASYFAAAVMMPYARFLRACEATGYDLELLQRRFGAGFEQVAHRLTTLQRVGARGLPFFMVRIDRAGQASKRFSGASGVAAGRKRRAVPVVAASTTRSTGRATLAVQLVELEDGARWLTMSRTVTPQGRRYGAVRAEFAVGLGVAADLAGSLAAARGIDLKGEATPIGLGCRACGRSACPQRSAPPAGRALLINERERGVSAFTFGGD